MPRPQTRHEDDGLLVRLPQRRQRQCRFALERSKHQLPLAINAQKEAHHAVAQWAMPIVENKMHQAPLIEEPNIQSRNIVLPIDLVLGRHFSKCSFMNNTVA